MKKIIVYASALVFAGGVSFAMEEGSDGMDKDMMAAAPSVAVGGSAKMGIKNTDAGLSLIKEYEVSFSSSGVTDGGLMFGASISFDEGAAGTKTMDAGTAMAMPQGAMDMVEVNGYAATQYVWVVDGTLGIAIAQIDHDNDDDTDEIDITDEVAMTYNTAVDEDGDEVNANKLRKVMLVFDAAAGTATFEDIDDLDDGDEAEPNSIPVTGFTRERASVMVRADNDTDTNTHKVRNGIGNASVYVGAADGSWKLKFGTDLDAGIYKIGDIGVAGEGDAFYATSGHSIELSGSFEGAEYSITTNAASGAAKNEWSAGVKYNAGTISVGVGMDSAKGLGLSLNTDVSGVSAGMIYTKAEMGMGDTMESRSGLGISAGMAAGEGANVTLKYSTLKTEGGEKAGTTKLIEADFTYDLGGGAKFGAGFDNKDTNGSKATTLEATIAMSF